MKKSILLPLSILLFSAPLFNVYSMDKSSEVKSQVEQVQQAVIDINNADINTLATLKGVGLKRAQAIIDYREQHGKFTSLEQLLEVKGIGSTFIQKNKALIKI
ncbi:ComEA family DNA-binding protein [Thalassotalea piscium]